MRVARLILSFLLLFFFSPRLNSQQPITAAQRDTQAVTAVQTAITAQGSQSAIGAIANAVVQGTIVPTQSSTVNGGDFKWESDFSESTYEFRSEMQIGGTTRVFATGHGNPAFYNGKTVRRLFSHVAYASVPFHLPAVVLFRELNDPNRSLQFVGTTTINGTRGVHIRTYVATGPIETELSVHHWYFDSSTGLPVRVEYRTPNTLDMRDNIPAAVDFSNYKVIDGIAVPLTITASEDGKVVSTATVLIVTFNSGVSPTDFDLKTGGAL